MKQVLLSLLLFTAINSYMQAQNRYEQDTFETTRGPLVITFYGHGTLRFDWNGKVIHVDPWSRMADYTKEPKADIILITHEHVDHLDKNAVMQARKESTSLLVNRSVRDKLGEGTVMVNGESKQVEGIRIEAVPAYNLSPGHEQFHPKGRDNGYVIDFGGTKVYVAGDTEDIPEMEKLKGINIAFLPVNQPYTMTPEQLAHAAAMIRPEILYPYHYSETDVEKVKAAMASSPGIELRIRKMQ